MEQKICPKCKSKDLQMCIPSAWVATTGLNPGWRCNKCELELPEFPSPKDKIKKTIKKR
ncbi:MAG: hypothetical protein AABW47_02080 [Nanoarchaeota archaeon]